MMTSHRQAPDGAHLLAEPLTPPAGARLTSWPGWRRDHDEIVREPLHDVWGATVQSMIVDYVLRGTKRSAIARRHSTSERQVQAYLSGQAWRSYSLPVLGTLKRLGLGAKRSERLPRAEAALLALTGHAAAIVALLADDQRPEAQQIVADLRILGALAAEGGSP